MSALEEYLDEFFRDCVNIPEFKIDFLKNHYYDRINKIISIDREDFLIGTERKLPIIIRKRFLFFKSRKNSLFEIIYDIQDDKYAVRYKNNPQIYNISTLYNSKYINNIDSKMIDKNIIDNHIDNHIDNSDIDNNNSCIKSCRFKLYSRSCCII